MELKGEVLIAASRDKVWEGLNNTQTLIRCIPGCESMEEINEHERKAIVQVKVGPVRARFAGHVTMRDVQKGVGYTLQFEGSGGAAGMAKGHSVLQLVDQGESTLLSYTTQASIGGKLGQVGGRMIDGAAKQIADQFFNAFQKEMSGAPTPAAAGTEAVREVTQEAVATDPVAANTLGVDVSPPVTRSELLHSEFSRVVWFLLGVFSTGLGVWMGRLIS